MESGKPEETVLAEVIHDQDNDQRIYIQLELLDLI